MEAFSALLALCAGEFTGPGEFPAQGPVTRSFDVFFDLRRNKRLSKHREVGDLRRLRGHYDVNVMNKNVLLTLTSMCLYIYAYRSICFIYIYMHMYMCYFYFI